MKIEIISGSTREASITKRVALHLYTTLRQATPHEVGLIDLSQWELPFVTTVFTSIDNTPENFRPLAKRMFEADAFVLVTPEYNGSYSPALKNLLDHFPKQHHKAFGLVTASPGGFGGMRAAQQLLNLVPALFGLASPYLLIVPAVDKKFNAQGGLVDENFQHSIHNFISEFLWLAEKTASPQMHPELQLVP